MMDVDSTPPPILRMTKTIPEKIPDPIPEETGQDDTAMEGQNKDGDASHITGQNDPIKNAEIMEKTSEAGK